MPAKRNHAAGEGRCGKAMTGKPSGVYVLRLRRGGFCVPVLQRSVPVKGAMPAVPGASSRHEASEGLSADSVLQTGVCAITAGAERRNCFCVWKISSLNGRKPGTVHRPPSVSRKKPQAGRNARPADSREYPAHSVWKYRLTVNLCLYFNHTVLHFFLFCHPETGVSHAGCTSGEYASS